MLSEHDGSTPLALARRARYATSHKLRLLLAAANRPGSISFAVGLPDPALLPRHQIAEAAAQVLHEQALSLQMGPPYEPLKEQIVALMGTRGVRCTKAQVLLTTGAQQGLDLVARLLLDPGTPAVVESRAYPGFAKMAELLEVPVLTVPTQPETGVDLEALERALAQTPKPGCMYLIPDGHNPLGVSLSVERRMRLVELARRYRVPIIEDDVYGLLHHTAASPAPLRALDEEWVFYAGSFSKVLGPALRVGWVVASERYIEQLACMKDVLDLDCSTTMQRVLAQYLASGHMPTALDTARSAYRQRLALMTDALSRHLPPETRWHAPSAGFYLWVRFPPGPSSLQLFEAAVKEGVVIVPGNAFGPDDGPSDNPCARLCFACPAEQIEEGVARLGRAWNRVRSVWETEGRGQ